MNREQELIDILFQVAYMVHSELMRNKNYHTEIAPWIVNQLHQCGFEGKSMGMSWFVLDKK